MHTISHKNNHFRFDASTEPILTVTPGEEVTFETLDACLGEVRSTDEFLRRREAKRPSGPLTGPVYINGAAPGDTLTVQIMDVKLDATGFQLIGPDRALVENEVPDWTCYVVKTGEDHLTLPNGMELPIDPVIGTFGNAPAGDPTSLANRLGGNMDVPAVKTGCTLYIPVEVPGTLFSLGDVHACQGDGEVVGAPEIGATVTVRFGLLKEEHSEWVMIEDDECWHTPCPGESEYEAARRAVFNNADFISREHGIEFKDALILLTMVGRLSLSRTGKWGPHGLVVCSSFSKEMVKRATSNYVTENSSR